MDATQIVLIVFIAVLVIVYPIMMFTRNKKENQRMQEQTNSLKRGDKILTTSGIYGTVVDLHLEEDRKVVTIVTGTDKEKGYLSIDAYAIYKIFKEEKQDTDIKQVEVDEPKEIKKDEPIESQETTTPNEDK